MNTMWNEYHKKIKNKKLEKDLNTDILIIGGGLSGIETAFYLKNSNYKVSLIEAKELLSGTTNYTTAKVTFMQEELYKIQNKNMYLKSQLDAIKLIKENIKKYKIDCDLSIEDSYIFANEFKNIKKVKKIENILKQNNIKYEITNILPNNFKCAYAIKTKDSMTFNPIKYAYGLLDQIKNLDIYEHTRALKIKKENDYYIIKTNKGNIKAKYLITTTQYPFYIIPGLIPFKVHLKKSHVVASKIKIDKPFNAINVDKELMSMRYYKDYFIFGGESYKMSNHINYLERQKKLEDKFNNLFNGKIEYTWETYDLVSNDYLPIIGKVDKNHYVECAYNAWGMTNSTIASKLISDLILNIKNPYERLFKPKRKITLNRCLNFLIDNVNITKIYLRTKFFKHKSFYKNNVKIITKNGKNYGIYIDEHNKEHIVRNLCPHAKCSLIFNYDDKTWDCPCHGSKYDIDGNVIKGPSVYDIKK